MTVTLPTLDPHRLSTGTRLVADPATLPAAPPLRLLFWETTVGCNLACIHCRRLEVSRDLSRFDLTTDQSKNFFRTLKVFDRNDAFLYLSFCE